MLILQHNSNKISIKPQWEVGELSPNKIRNLSGVTDPISQKSKSFS